MSRLLMLGAMGICLAWGGAARGQAIEANPIFNSDATKAWLVRYDEDKANGNKRGNVAVQLQLLSDDSSKTRLTGTLLLYDGVKVSDTNKKVYRRQSTPGGRVLLVGTASAPSPGKARKPLRFTATGTYIDEQNQVHVVVVRGIYHAGRLITGATQRDDDRLLISIVDKKQNNNNPNNPNNPMQLDADPLNVFVLFQNMPCEDEPDVDVLQEEIYDPEPAYAPVP